MSRRLLVFSVVAAFWLIVALPARARSHGLTAMITDVAPGAGLRELTADTDGVAFTLSVPSFDVETSGSVEAPGLDKVLARPGAPALPYYSALIALPPNAAVDVSLAISGAQEIRAPYEIAPAADLADPGISDDGRPNRPEPGAEADLRQDESIYQNEALFPTSDYSLSEPVYYRDLRFARLDLYPIRYNPVSRTIHHVREMQVSVRFSETGKAGQYPKPLDSRPDPLLEALADDILNSEHISEWRSLPDDFVGENTVLPVGVPTFKIRVEADGIYELTRDDLEGAGMVVGNVDPEALKLLYRGEPVAYQIRGNNGNGTFDSFESILFYGWPFDGSRLERQFFDDNVFWLWEGGNGPEMVETPNVTSHPPRSSFRDTVTREIDWIYAHTRTDDWDSFPNEPDAWYWDRIAKAANSPPLDVTKTITLPHPAPGAAAELTVELLSRHTNWLHDVSVYINGDPSHAGNAVWSDIRNVNVTTTVPVTALLDGPNEAHIVFNTANTGDTWYYLNRISVEYDRLLIAEDQQLVFDTDSGPYTYSVSGFSEWNPSKIFVWDISDRLLPKSVPMDGNISGGTSYTYTFGGGGATGAAYVVAHAGSTRSPVSIERYVPPQIDPAGGADWVAVTHGDFWSAAESLAAHRRDPRYGGLKTHVVKIDDVINQYGYGLPIPGAINSYLKHALADWSVKPRYLILIGDASVNPRQIPCPTTVPAECSFWGDDTEPTYVMTDLVFKDRINGLIPSDHSLALLVGDDLAPDIGVGRLAVKTSAEAQHIVDKIVQFEETRLNPEPWQTNLLFVGDNADSAGDFCLQNQAVISQLPAAMAPQELCLDDYPLPGGGFDYEAMRRAMGDWLNESNKLVTMLNYRGHGAINSWAGDFVTLSTGIWRQNPPTVVLSMDCLDGHFAFPGYPALSEYWLALDTVGSVAHWSSTGFGYTSEHTILHKGFFEGLFDNALTAIGDSTVYSKLYYFGSGAHTSELYSFTLQGDPAMQLMRPDLKLFGQGAPAVAEPGDTLTYEFSIENANTFPAPTTVTVTLPPALSPMQTTANVDVDVTINSGEIVFDLLQPLNWNDTAVLNVVASVAQDFGGNSVAVRAEADGTAMDVNPLDNETTIVTIIGQGNNLLLPLMLR